MSDDYSDFTKLVLARMETNPEEFFSITQTYTRWDGLTRGLESLARGDTESKAYTILWPLTDEERAALLDGYRKLYLNELHRDMLKSIVSGNDKEKYDIAADRSYTIGLGKQASQGTLRGAVPLTATAIQQSTLVTLNRAFDDVYSNAPVKAEGAQIDPNTLTYKATNRYIATEQRAATKLKKVLISPADVRIADKLGMTVEDYIKRRDAA